MVNFLSCAWARGTARRAEAPMASAASARAKVFMGFPRCRVLGKSTLPQGCCAPRSGCGDAWCGIQQGQSRPLDRGAMDPGLQSFLSLGSNFTRVNYFDEVSHAELRKNI